MKEIFLEYAKKGAMTKEELAEVLKVKPSHVGTMARSGKIPKLPHTHLIRFDPMAMIDVFCQPQKTTSSLTIERHKTRARTNGGYRKCL